MEGFVRGEVVIVPFPFSDISQAKRRPALVLADLEGEDLILCQITSQARHDRYSVPLTRGDFEVGELRVSSYIRPNRLFTADSHIIVYRVGNVYPQKLNEVIDRVITIIKARPAPSAP